MSRRWSPPGRLVLCLVAGVLLAGACALAFQGGPGPVVGPAPPMPAERFRPSVDEVRVEIFARGLEIPWAIVFLPDGRVFVSERPGRIRLIQRGELRREPYAQLPVLHSGEGGLMGLAAHPRFPAEPSLYAMYTYRGEGGRPTNRVVRLRDRGAQGTGETVIVDGIPGARFHNGGRIRFGPDGRLYIGTGDAGQPELAQDPRSLGGKILRVEPDGRVPDDNPVRGSRVFSMGHRNVQGLAWHPGTGTLFASEHGPSGEWGLQGRDTVRIIIPGGNHGWPRQVGVAGRPGFQDPLLMWDPSVPPGGMIFYTGKLLRGLEGDLFLATLRSEHLQRIMFREAGRPHQVTGLERWFARARREGVFGRLRDVVQGPEGALYVATSNRDGRGTVRPDDDKILRLLPAR